VIVSLLAFAGGARAAEPSADLPETATKLFATLTPEQRAQALLPFDSPERDSQVFTGGRRPGIPLKDLTDEQRASAMSLLKGFTSEYGAAKCEAVANQDEGLGLYYLCFFGEPGPGKRYAWRIAEHHLTLVHVEVDNDQPTSFGPILLGADPGVLWDDEEDALIALYAALTPEEKQKVARRGRGISSELFKDGEGVAVRELSPAAREKLQAVLDGRLKFFAPAIQQRIRDIADKQGGLDAMRLAFWGTADKRCAQGGRWDFKLGGPTFLCDYENSRGHIHMAMKGRLSER
jgi:hypothetical protein